MPHFTGINHIELAATDILKTKEFYCDILGLEYLPQYDHRAKDSELFAVMLQIQHLTSTGSTTPILVEIRHNPEQAQAQQGWDPLTIGMKTKRDLEDCKAWYESKGIMCSRVFTGLKAWVLCALDPDGKIARTYCEEEHEWTTDFDHDDFWLR